MKKLVGIIGCWMLMITGIMHAQNQSDNFDERKMCGGPRGKMDIEEMMEKRVERMSQELSLNEAQKSEIKKILTDDMKEMETSRASEFKKEREEMMKKMKAHHEELDKKIEKVLTNEQKEKYSNLKNNLPANDFNGKKSKKE